jgi:hypothetical protein
VSIHNKSVALVCAGLVVCRLLVGAARAQAVSFEEGQTFKIGDVPESVATGDFDGDGLPDLVTAHGSSTVSVLLGDGHGGFGRLQTFSLLPLIGSYSVAAADFNGDGLHDFVVTFHGFTPQFRGGFVVFLSNGLGSFRRAGTYETGTRALFITTGDFNGDGVPDLAVIHGGHPPGFPDSNVAILLGDGQGNFQQSETLSLGNQPIFAAAGDFNGDGYQDLAVVNQGSRDVSVFLSNGDGSFQPPRHLEPNSGPVSVAIADFDRDGWQDLAVAHASKVSVFLGNGDGSFQPARQSPCYGGQIVAADFNGDGFPAILVSGVWVLLGNGDGSFQSPRGFVVGDSRFIAVDDFNGDGVPDVAVANHSGSSVTVLLGTSDGSFPAPRRFSAGNTPSSVAVGDFNGDSVQDLAAANLFSNDISVLLGNGDGSFQPPLNVPVGSYPSSIAVGDFNGDEIQDLAVANYGSGDVSVLLGNGDGSFQALPTTFPAGTNPASIAVGDFNRDGLPDVAVANDGSNNVSVLLGNGDGTFREAQNLAAGNRPECVAVGDFNGDKVPDLVVANFIAAGTITVLLGNGDGSFQEPLSFPVGSYPFSVAVGDFNGDGMQDLAVANYGTFPEYLDSSVSILLGNGNGNFLVTQSLRAGSSPMSVAVGDFNGDRLPDLAVANDRSDFVSVFLGNGDGTFQEAQNFVDSYFDRGGIVDVVVGDFNSDERTDLAEANGMNVTVLLNNTPIAPTTRPADRSRGSQVGADLIAPVDR